MGISIVKAKGAGGGGDLTTLYIDNTTHSHTGDILEWDAASYTMPASTLAATDGLEIELAGTKTGAVNIFIVYMYFGGVAVHTSQPSAVAATDWSLSWKIYNTAANAQRSTYKGFIGTTRGDYNTAAIDTTAQVIIKVALKLSNAADTVTQEMFIVKQVLTP